MGFGPLQNALVLKIYVEQSVLGRCREMMCFWRNLEIQTPKSKIQNQTSKSPPQKKTETVPRKHHYFFVLSLFSVPFIGFPITSQNAKKEIARVLGAPSPCGETGLAPCRQCTFFSFWISHIPVRFLCDFSWSKSLCKAVDFVPFFGLLGGGSRMRHIMNFTGFLLQKGMTCRTPLFLSSLFSPWYRHYRHWGWDPKFKKTISKFISTASNISKC